MRLEGFNAWDLVVNPDVVVNSLKPLVQILFYIIIGPVCLFYLGARNPDHQPIIKVFTAANIIIAAFCIYNNAVTSGADGGVFFVLIYIACSWIISILSATLASLKM